eukprot:TRINITY_DN1638_c0_g1_i3.p2 TRINITY_DN1638_c0_g1~~TRINITY_DN1638_c0_g1_i3.p2  ORF type:complete len:138 (+),score=24.24 TRINITY_DN1638_c0_g1_i3:198-611(+)
MKKPPLIVSLIVLAFFVAIGIGLDILACALWANWWPILVIIFYTLAPLPNLMFAHCADPVGEGFMDSRARAWKDTGFFITGMFIFSGLGLPIVLYHTEVIALGQMLLALGGGLITYTAFVIYIHFFHPTKAQLDEWA